MNKLRLGILVSGNGSNLQAIIDNINAGKLDASIAVVISDNPDAFALERARKAGIEACYLSYNEKDYIECLHAHKVSLVCLAGFMRIIKKPFLEEFPNKIINIHPALLPSFPGLDVQKKALDYGVKVSGCTVHFVDEGTDTGPIIVQAAVPVEEDDTAKTLADRILKQEHRIYSDAINLIAQNKVQISGRCVKIKK